MLLYPPADYDYNHARYDCQAVIKKIQTDLMKSLIVQNNPCKMACFYAVVDRIPRVYPWMNEPDGGIRNDNAGS